MKFFGLFLVVLLTGCATQHTLWDSLPATHAIGSQEIKALPKRITALELMKKWGKPTNITREAVMVYPTTVDGITLCVALQTESLPIDVRIAEVKMMFFCVNKETLESHAWESAETQKNKQ